MKSPHLDTLRRTVSQVMLNRKNISGLVQDFIKKFDKENLILFKIILI